MPHGVVIVLLIDGEVIGPNIFMVSIHSRIQDGNFCLFLWTLPGEQAVVSLHIKHFHGPLLFRFRIVNAQGGIAFLATNFFADEGLYVDHLIGLEVSDGGHAREHFLCGGHVRNVEYIIVIEVSRSLVCWPKGRADLPATLKSIGPKALALSSFLYFNEEFSLFEEICKGGNLPCFGSCCIYSGSFIPHHLAIKLQEMSRCKEA